MRKSPPTAFHGADALQALGDVVKGRAGGGEQRVAGFRQRDGARGAGKKRLTDALLDQPHGMAHRRRAHAERGGGRSETAAPGDGDDDGQVAEQVAIHS